MNATTISTKKVRLSYCHLFTPVKAPGSDVEKYSVSVIIPKTDKATLNAINAAVEEAKKEGASKKWGGKIPGGLHLPLRDGDADRPDDEAYANSYFFNCSSTRKPEVVDENGNAILNAAEVYSGCYGRVNVNFFAYNSNGNKGIAAGLNCIQKLEDGQALGASAPSAKAAFGINADSDADLFEE